MFLYHATDREDLPSILKDGLLIYPPKHHWNGMYCEGYVFLAFDPDVAKDYLAASDDAPEDIVILKIDLSNLDETHVGYDWNNRCEYEDEINSITYDVNIPAKHIQLVEDRTTEPLQDVYSFKGTLLYDYIMCVFDEEVETNLQREEVLDDM